MASRTRKTLSVLLPTYNHARFLTRAVLSIAQQSRTPDELIVVDDGSTDNSYDILKRLAERFPFMKIGRNKKNIGLFKTIQNMTNMASGDYLSRVSADDYALQGYVETLMDLAEEYPQAGIVSGGMLYTRGSLEFNWCLNRRGIRFPVTKYFGMGNLKRGYYSPAAYLHFLETKGLLGTLSPTTLYRRDLVCEFGGWPNDLGSHEVSFILQALGLKAGVAYTPRPLFVFFIRHSSFGHVERADREQTQSLYRRYVSRMDEPTFAGLFSKTFADRWLDANWNN